MCMGGRCCQALQTPLSIGKCECFIKAGMSLTFVGCTAFQPRLPLHQRVDRPVDVTCTSSIDSHDDGLACSYWTKLAVGFAFLVLLSQNSMVDWRKPRSLAPYERPTSCEGIE